MNADDFMIAAFLAALAEEEGTTVTRQFIDTLRSGGVSVEAEPPDTIGDALRADCKAYWKLDETSGNRLDSKNSHHLVPVGSVSQAAGKVGNAAGFDGELAYTEDQQYLVAPSHTDLAGGDSNSFTIAGWIYVTNFDFDAPCLLSKAGDDTTEYLIITSVQKPQFTISGGVATDALSTIVMDAGVWYFVVAWYDLSIRTSYISVNQETPVVGSSAGVTLNAPYDPLGTVLSGAYYEADPANFTHGRHDELGFWQRVLTADERAYLYNSGAGKTLYP